MLENIIIRNAKVGWLNFTGAEKNFNPEGRRNFCVFLDPEDGDALKAKGWNVKTREPRTEDEDPVVFMKVAVEYKRRPPLVSLINSRVQRYLDQNTIGILDWSEIQKVDVVIRPYEWDYNGKTGTKAILKELYVTVVEPVLAHEYSHIPLAADHDPDHLEDEGFEDELD